VTKRKYHAGVSRISAIFLGLGLAACQNVTKLPDGQFSIMVAANNKLRSELMVAPNIPQSPFNYRAVKSCIYSGSTPDETGAIKSTHTELSIKASQNRFLVVANEDGKVTTALIQRNGKIDDFNGIVSNGQRVTADSFGNYASQRLAEDRNKNLNNAHVLNTISVVLPEYANAPRRVGDAVAEVKVEDGSMWATYYYKGTTQYRNTAAYVLDLERISGGMQDRIVVGFDVVDSKTMLPLLLVLDSGASSRIEQTSCQE
jgi:hypothetical protein